VTTDESFTLPLKINSYIFFLVKIANKNKNNRLMKWPTLATSIKTATRLKMDRMLKTFSKITHSNLANNFKSYRRQKQFQQKKHQQIGLWE
jgi:hypothetical protein